MVFDLEQPWPLQENSVEQILAHHILEHLGESVRTFLAVIAEMYRVSAPHCEWIITVPDPNSDVFDTDPTHVRKITPAMLKMFDQQDNVNDMMAHGHYTNLGLMHGIDLEVLQHYTMPLDPYRDQLERGELTVEQLNFMGRHYRNVAQETTIQCRVHKPQRYGRDILTKFNA